MPLREFQLQGGDLPGALDALLAVFDDVDVGERLILRGRGTPTSLVMTVGEERPHQFSWRILELDDDGYVLELTRWGAHEDTGLAHQLRARHRNFDRLLASIESQLSQGLLGDARRGVAHLREELEQHLDFEDAVVSPEYEREPAARADAPPPYLHPHLRRALGELEQLVTASDVVGATRVISDLNDLLGPHFTGQEQRFALGAD